MKTRRGIATPERPAVGTAMFRLDPTVARQIAAAYPQAEGGGCVAVRLTSESVPFHCHRAVGHDGPHVSYRGNRPVAAWPV